jgi:putative Holliday junction resolvase
MERGVRLGVDVGSVRIGVAASDPEGIMAFPVETVPTGDGDAARVAAIASDRNATTIFVGLPRTLKGGHGASVEMARSFATKVSELTTADVRLIDERFSTASASRALTGAGKSAKKQRAIIDQAAAVVILETALEVDRQGNLGKVTEWIPREDINDRPV